MTSPRDPRDDGRDLFGEEPDSGIQKVPTYLWKFANDHALLSEAASEVERFLREIAVDTTASYHAIDGRSKSLKSYTEKSFKKNPDDTWKYLLPASEIQDGVAVRVIVYTLRDRDKLAEGLESRTTRSPLDNPGERSRNGYSSTHCIVSGLVKEDDWGRYPSLIQYLERYPGFEVQIRSVAEHAWAEFEHDIRYKSEAYRALPKASRARVDQLLVEAGGTRVDIDRRFNEVDEILYPEIGEGAAVVGEVGVESEVEGVEGLPGAEPGENETITALDSTTLREFVDQRYGHRGPEAEEDVALLVSHLETLQIVTIEALETILADLDEGYVARLMKYQSEVTGSRRLDDELLAKMRQAYVDAAPEGSRRSILGYRLRRVSGKLNIYATVVDGKAGRLLSAARTLRELTAEVAGSVGVQSAVVSGYSSLDREELNASLKPKKVQSGDSEIWVASNLTRESAEIAMRILIERTAGQNLRVERAGDILFESPAAEREATSAGFSDDMSPEGSSPA